MRRGSPQFVTINQPDARGKLRPQRILLESFGVLDHFGHAWGHNNSSADESLEGLPRLSE